MLLNGCRPCCFSHEKSESTPAHYNEPVSPTQNRTPTSLVKQTGTVFLLSHKRLKAAIEFVKIATMYIDHPDGIFFVLTKVELLIKMSVQSKAFF